MKRNFFRDAQFRYWYRGKQIPGATGVLKAQGMVDQRFFDAESRTRGRAVHVATQHLDKGKLRWWTVDEAHVGFIRSYQKALASTRAVPCDIWTERPLLNKTYLYGVTPDRVLAWPGVGWAIWELKTGALYDAVALQTIAQKDTVQPHFRSRVRRFGVALRRDGKMPNIHEYKNDAHDRGVFLGALSAMKWRIAHDLIEGY